MRFQWEPVTPAHNWLNVVGEVIWDFMLLAPVILVSAGVLWVTTTLFADYARS